MSDVERLLNSVKKLAVDAVDNSKPSNLVIGKVISVTPLKVELDNDVVLTADMLSFVKPAVSEGTYDTTFDVGVTSTGVTNISGTATITGDAEVRGTISEMIELDVTGEDIKPNTKARGRISIPVTLSGDSQGSGPVTGSGNTTVNGRARGGSEKVLASYELWIESGDEVALLMYPGGNRYLIVGCTVSAVDANVWTKE